MAGTPIDLSTAGVTLLYCVESTAGTKPTTGFTKISGIKSVPDMNVEPEALQSTTLEATRYHTYVEGLRDIGGSLAFGANLTEVLMDEWEDVIDAYETAAASNKATWFAIVVPGLTNALYFTGKPAELGMPAMEVNAVLETQLYITPTNEPTWDAKPTTTSGSGG